MRGRYGDRSEAERRPPTGIASSKMEPSEPDLTSLNSPPWFLTKVEAASNRQHVIVISAIVLTPHARITFWPRRNRVIL